MQGGVIGGICLLTFLLSVGRGEEFDVSKQLEESNIDTIKGTSSKEDVRLSTEDTDNLKATFNDLNNSNLTVGVKETNSIEESKPSLEAQPLLGELSKLSESSIKSNQSSSEHSGESSNWSQSPRNSAPYTMNSQSNVQDIVPSVTFNDQSDNTEKKLYFTPQGIPVSYPNTKINSAKEGIQMRTGANDSPYYAGMDILPPLYSAHLASLSEKSAQKDSSSSFFSPVFSGDANHYPAPGSIAPAIQAANTKTLPAYSYVNTATFEESRRDLKKDDKQARNVEESQYSESRNAYPYSPPSKPDSTSSENNELRSGAQSYPFYENKGISSAQAYAGAFTDSLSQNNQGSDPYSFGYPPGPGINSGNTVSANAFAQVMSSGSTSPQNSAIVIEDAHSRVIWPNELIFPSKIPGGENAIQCTKENEMYHYWSKSFDCLVCVCLNVYGLLEPVCGKCSGCQKTPPFEAQTFITEQSPPVPEFKPLPLPESYVPLPKPIHDPYAPSASAPSLIVEPIGEQNLLPTTPPPVREVPVTCSPLPTGQAFTNPLHPCQLCTCKEIVKSSGATDVRIECQDNRECVLPQDITTLPPIPDIPVPVALPLCEKFPPHVTFPHPTASCKVCKCSLELSEGGVPEQQITCYHDTECEKKTEPTKEPITPPAPPIPIPVEPYAGPIPQPAMEPIPENIPLPIEPPKAVKPEEPLPWPPISTPAPPPIPYLPKKGPLPGPSPHDSCQPYPPDQPFQHPWDDCQVCQCSVIQAYAVVNVEITCYTKLSCCIESPEQAITESDVVNNEGSQAKPNNQFNTFLSSTVKPPRPINTYNPGDTQNQGYAKAKVITQNQGNTHNQGYATANAISQNSGDSQNQGSAQANAMVYNTAEYNPQGITNQGYAAANAVSQSQGTAEPSSIVYNTGEYNSHDLQNQGLSQATAIAQSDVHSLSNQLSGPYQSLQGSGQSLAEANAAYTSQGSFKPFQAEIAQNQGYAEANAVSQNSMRSSLYPEIYQPTKVFGNVNGQTTADASAEYISLPLINSYNTGVPQNLGYVEDNTVVPTSLSSSSFQPPRPYQSAVGSVNNDETSEGYVPLSIPYKGPLQTQYNTRVPQNSPYLSSISTNDKLISTTYMPPLQYDSYNQDNTQNEAYSEAVAQYNDRRTNTQKPLLFGQYTSGFSQSQAAQANAQYNSILTSTYKPPALYGQYNPGILQNQVHANPNALYKGTLSISDKPPLLYNPYNSGGSQNNAYAGANALVQNANPGYYLSGQYPSPKAVGNVNGGDQSSAVAEANAQSQDYPPYYHQPGSQVGAKAISKLSLGYPYQSNYYFQNPQYPINSYKANTGLKGQYKVNPTKYAGNYDFNGQADAINIYSPQSNHNPYSGYSQSLPNPNLYSSPYPKNYNYEMTPLYRPEQYGSSNAQNTAEAFGGSKSQIRSGEGNKEDLDETK